MTYVYDPPAIARGDDALSNLQVRARPHDALSPFIWGYTARMLVEGGAWEKPGRDISLTDSKGMPRKLRTISLGYEGETLTEPSLSDNTTTVKLWKRMRAAGFTLEEIESSFHRYKDTGGAFYVYKRHTVHSSEKWEEWRGKLYAPLAVPVSIDTTGKRWNSWRGIDNLPDVPLSSHPDGIGSDVLTDVLYDVLYSLTSYSGIGSKCLEHQEQEHQEQEHQEQEHQGPRWTSSKGSTYNVEKGNVWGALLAISTTTSLRYRPGQELSWEVEGQRWTTNKAIGQWLQDSDQLRYPWSSKRVRYLNIAMGWLEESSHLLVTTRTVPGATTANRKPRGFRVHPIYRDTKAMSLFWSAWDEGVDLDDWAIRWAAAVEAYQPPAPVVEPAPVPAVTRSLDDLLEDIMRPKPKPAPVVEVELTEDDQDALDMLSTMLG